MTVEPVRLDVRPLPAPERHPRIFAILDALAVGGRLVLVNDHDPKPLRYQVQAEAPECFSWESRQTGDQEWTVTIERLAAGPKLGELGLPGHVPRPNPRLRLDGLVRRYPWARRVLERHGIDYDEAAGLTIEEAARRAGLDPDELIADLDVGLVM